ncbi:LPXTG cell wall anchor domain-containing protein [Streptomyces sp. NPDC051183]|uniref:LPXTG cell wall anchor domain-containing protein n=1 Tax=unclassified Streptomyces TaxID=2593676 RepID=UPI00342F9A89
MLTALGATTLLAVLWFVPSANATAPGHGTDASGAPSEGLSVQTAGSAELTGSGEVTLGLADTGSIDTTPYLLGGTLCLGLGAGFVTFSVRRSRAL